MGFRVYRILDGCKYFHGCTGNSRTCGRIAANDDGGSGPDGSHAFTDDNVDSVGEQFQNDPRPFLVEACEDLSDEYGLKLHCHS